MKAENQTDLFKTCLDEIIENVRLHNVISIILYGGYGRNEGSIVINQNNEVKPYNDFDIMLIVKSKIDKDVLKEKSIALAKSTGINWVDLSQMTLSDLKLLKPSIYNYDLKYASKVLYGDKNILNVIPEIQSKNLPLKEVETLFLTRIWTLVGCLDNKGLLIDRSGDDVRFFRNQMAKSVLAIVDILLINLGEYNFSYKVRVQLIKKHYSWRPELISLSEWALDEKLFPKSLFMSKEEISDLYNQVIRLFFKEMFSSLSLYYKRQINKPEDVEYCLKWYWLNLVKRCGSYVLYRDSRRERQIRIHLAQIYIAYSHISNNPQYLDKSNLIIRKLEQKSFEPYDWDEARCRIAKIRLEN
jgi:hypothetical protein